MDLSDGVIINSSRLKSVVWNDFDRVKKGDMLVAICKHCKKKMSGSGTSGTSHLRNHLLRCQRRGNRDVGQYIPPREKKRGRPASHANTNNQEHKKDEPLALTVVPVLSEDQLKDEPMPLATLSCTFDQRRSQFDLARMIILHGYPLTMVEHVGFKIFIKNVQPLFELMASSKVEADCLEIYEKEKQKLFEMLDKLPGKISLCVDEWSSSDESKYLGLTAHFVDDSWQLRKKVLSFLMIDYSQTEDMQADAIMKCLMDWDIDRKLFSMTSDGCSANNIVSRIKDRLSQNRFLFGSGQLFDVRCLASVLNQMVHIAVEALSDIIPKIRESIQYVKSSKEMHEKFNQMVNRENIEDRKCLSLDNRSRWDSTFRMLEAAIVYKGAFSLLREGDSAFKACPSDEEWEKVGSVTGFLNVFLDIINDFTKSKYRTANIYFPLICDIYLKMIEWCDSSDNFISSLAVKMRSEFNVYWEKCGLALGIAAFLDPRFKMKMVEYYFPQIYGTSSKDHHVNEVRDRIKALYNEHSIGSPLASDDPSLAWQVSGASGPGNVSKDRLSGFEKFLNETSQSDGTKTDLDKYLEEPLFPRNADFSILNWWKVHTPRYPILSLMARNILGIQMSKVSSESAFDLVGRTLDRDRSSLSPATVEALMCSQDWIGSELEN